MFRVFGVAVALAAFGSIAALAQDDAAAFAELEQFQSANLSPDGTRIAYIEGGTGEPRTIVIAPSRSPGEVIDRMEFAASTTPVGVQWLNDENVFLSLAYVREVDGEPEFGGMRLVRRLSDGGMVAVAPDTVLLSTAIDLDETALFVQPIRGGVDIYELDLDNFAYDRHSHIASRNGPPASFALAPDGRRMLTLIGERGLFRVHSAVSRLSRGIIHRETFEIDREARHEGSNWSRWSGMVERLEGLTKDGDRAVFSSSTDAATGGSIAGGRRALYTIDIREGTIEGPIVSSDQADVTNVLMDWRDNTVIGATVGSSLQETVYLSGAFQQLQDSLEARHPARRVTLIDWSADMSVVLFETQRVGQPGRLDLYFQETHEIVPVGERYPRVGEDAAVSLQVLDYTTRDGMDQFAYFTLPAGATVASPAPLVVMPHGGPQLRDYDDYDPLAQILVRAGYAVLQPQFRGSRGFGLEFLDAGEGEWAAAMQTDVYDGMAAAAATGVVDPERSCIIGWSYGGYAALISAVDESDLFRCTVSIAGVSDIEALMDHEVNRDDQAGQLYWSRVIGNWNHWGREARVLSPALRAENLDRPLLLMHGSLDAIVPVDQSEIFQDAANEAGQGDLVRSVYFDNARHAYLSFTTTDRERLLREMVDFLGTHLPVVEAPASTFPVETSPPAEGG